MRARGREIVSLDAIKEGLLGQLDALVHRLAPPAPDSYTKNGKYFTLNPGRADRSVGSFYIHMDGPMAGKWIDHATGAHGDILDLIALSLNLSPGDAIAEARTILGLASETPELRRAREKAAAEAKAKRAEQERTRAKQAEARIKWARGLWLSAQADLSGTPVDHYLRSRGLHLAQMAHRPHSIRYHPECLYIEERAKMDEETGEVFTDRTGRVITEKARHKLPAMVSAIVDGKGEIIACHRTYLAIGPSGKWVKAPFADAKSVLGSFKGGAIRLSTGIGPRGGKAAPLAKCPPGTRVYIAEGIETALSACVIKPEIRVLAAVALENMGAVDLPATVSDVVLIADHDEHDQAKAALQKAINAHAAKGRTVRVWRSERPGEDLNDVLQRMQRPQLGAV